MDFVRNKLGTNEPPTVEHFFPHFLAGQRFICTEVTSYNIHPLGAMFIFHFQKCKGVNEHNTSRHIFYTQPNTQQVSKLKLLFLTPVISSCHRIAPGHTLDRILCTFSNVYRWGQFMVIRLVRGSGGQYRCQQEKSLSGSLWGFGPTPGKLFFCIYESEQLISSVLKFLVFYFYPLRRRSFCALNLEISTHYNSLL